MRAATLALTLALACAGDSKDSETGTDGGASGTTSPGTTSSGTTSPATDPTGAGDSERPSGQSCALIGLYVDCAGGGRTYCDEFAGELRFGPCIDAPACELSGSQLCDKRCELVDGVPTWITIPDGCGSSGFVD